MSGRDFGAAAVRRNRRTRAGVVIRKEGAGGMRNAGATGQGGQCQSKQQPCYDGSWSHPAAPFMALSWAGSRGGMKPCGKILQTGSAKVAIKRSASPRIFLGALLSSRIALAEAISAPSQSQ